jgi:drug/metabolite transporter (DMT)-like permease
VGDLERSNSHGTRDARNMNDRRRLGLLVLMLGVLLVALPSAIGFLAGADVDQALSLTLSIAGVIVTVIGMAIASRSSPSTP